VPANNKACEQIPTGKPDIFIDKTLETLDETTGIFTLQPDVSGGIIQSGPIVITDDIPQGMEADYIGSPIWDCAPNPISGADTMILHRHRLHRWRCPKPGGLFLDVSSGLQWKPRGASACGYPECKRG